jgi:tellurite resistance protein TerC
MLALIEIEWWHYAAFLVAVLFVLALDLGVFHREAHIVRFREALGWSTLWFSLAMLFAVTLVPTLGRDAAQKFVLGYILELSLSMDNVFVIALIFGYFRVPLAYQHRVLFWGVIGAFVMRGVMIGLGAALVARFEWVLYLFGAFLVLTGVRMVTSKEEGVHPERNPVIRWARKILSGHHGVRWPEVCDAGSRATGADTAGVGAADGGNHGPSVRRGLDPGHFWRDA